MPKYALEVGGGDVSERGQRGGAPSSARTPLCAAARQQAAQEKADHKREHDWQHHGERSALDYAKAMLPSLGLTFSRLFREKKPRGAHA
jgi:hypothetical protein